MASNEQVIATLNDLIQTCRDGQEGFRTAAEGVRSAELCERFQTYARQRASFIGELQDEVRRLGGGAQEGGVAYAAHIGGFVAGLALVKFFAIGRGTAGAPARRGRY